MFAFKHEFNGWMSSVEIRLIRSIHGHDDAISSPTTELLRDLRGLPSDMTSNEISSLYL